MEDPEIAKRNKNKLKKHPRENAFRFTNLFFCWQIPIIVRGIRKEFTEEESYEPLKEYESENLAEKIENLWAYEEKFSKKPSLTKVLIKMFGIKLLLHGLLALFIETLNLIATPLYLTKILNYFSPHNVESEREGLRSVGLFLATSAIYILFYNWSQMQLGILGMKVRIAVSTLLFRKSLTMNQVTLQKVTMGQLINLLSNDVHKFDLCFNNLNYLWISPVIVIGSSIYIDLVYGHNGLYGIFAILLLGFFQIYLTTQITKFRKKVANRTDHRLRLMNDVVSGIQVIKLYAWETPFYKLVQNLRRIELSSIFKTNISRVVASSLKTLVTKICIFVAIIFLIVNGNSLTSGYVYGLIMIYDNIKVTCTSYFQVATQTAAEARVSLKRIEKFLLQNRSGLRAEKPRKSCPEKPKIVLENATIQWSNPESFSLENVNFEAQSRSLVGIIGPAGSGKSTFLQIILKELEVVKGRFEVQGTVSYSPQESWIFPSSVKQNIIFGEKFDLERYLKVLKVCSLERDLTLWSHGDQTLVGERGTMLSGGQKARITLARAIYRDADIYLLDDPLSAVDAHVAQAIFTECICDYLKDKIVVLVTHQVQFLKNVKKIYYINDGKMTETDRVIENLENENKHSVVPAEVQVDSLLNNDFQNNVKEHRSSGNQKMKLLFSYFKAAGHISCTIIITSMLFSEQFLINIIDFFLANWISLEEGVPLFNLDFSNIFSADNSIYTYAVLLLLVVVLHFIACYIFAKYCKKGSANLHSSILKSVLHVPLSFYNHHPSGQILNRFSKDMGAVDEQFPLNLYNNLTIAFLFMGSFFTIIYLNQYLVILVILFLAAVTSYNTVFRHINHNIKRTEATTRSSVLTHVTMTIQGLPIIRALGVQKTIAKEFDRYLNLNSSAMYMYLSTTAAFDFWTDITSISFVTSSVLTFFLFKDYLSSATAGLIITQAFSLARVVQVALRNWNELDAQLVSVERVIEYSKLESEVKEEDRLIIQDWPSSGRIEFQKVTLKYINDKPAVLKGIDLSIESGEKIGVVGRTGAGKSSLISVLFRLFEFDGTILIDGQDTQQLPIQHVRGKIAIIPQEPVLFLGSLRENVDPFHEYTDEQIWSCLEDLQLKKTVATFAGGLSYQVTEKGSNFSVGQRQLLCLVRAILRNNKIIVLDEATANIDNETDNVIQNVIRTKLRKCTVLTIAHRLNTIIDYDRVLVMDDGRVAEFGAPATLMENPDGVFYNLVKKNGTCNKET